ncbi:MAG: TonB family protein [Candidatus Methylomirabilales bacterium]
MAHGKKWKGLGGVGEKLTGSLERCLTGCEQSRLLSAYNRFRRRFSGPPVPGLPESSHLDPFVFMSVGIHLLILLLIYLLAARTLSLAERPPISVRILQTKAQAPARARKQKPLRQAKKKKRKAQKKPRQKSKPKSVPKPKPTPPKQVVKPKFTPKTLPRVAMVKPQVPKPLPKTVPQETLTPPKSKTPSPDRLISEKGLLPMPVKPFQAEPVPGGPPTEVPRSFSAQPPSAPAEAPTEIAPLPVPSATASVSTTPSLPTELGETTVKGFQEPTGPVVVPERFLKGGRPHTTPGAALELIDTSDPDFTEYFELIKRRVYAAWRYPEKVRGVHKVSLRFSLDRAGSARGIQVVRSTNAELNASAAEAMDRASPFPPIPEKFRALVGQPLTLIFTVTIR